MQYYLPFTMTMRIPGYVVKIFCGVLLCLGTNASTIISSNVLSNLPVCVRTKRACAITKIRFISRV